MFANFDHNLRQKAYYRMNVFDDSTILDTYLIFLFLGLSMYKSSKAIPLKLKSSPLYLNPEL